MSQSLSDPTHQTHTAKKVALVTGSNRGLGLETCRQLAKLDYRVILASRNEAKGQVAAAQLRSEKLDVTALVLDVTQDLSVQAAEQFVRQKFGRLDALVNNAGVFLESSGDAEEGSSALQVPVQTLRDTMEANTFGAYRMCQRFAPLLAETAKMPLAMVRVVNVSSGMGQLTEMNGSYPAYRISKTALNAVTRIFSEELSEHRILVNSICPGWVKTDMGGSEAELTPQEGADTITWAATLPDDGPTGGFFRERKRIDW